MQSMKKFLPSFFKNQVGFATIEYAVLTIAFLGMIISIVDLSRIYLAKQSVQYATSKTLRCLSPVDGKCLSEQIASYEPQYEVVKTKLEERWSYQNATFSGEASWLETPTILYSDPQATILDNITYYRKLYDATYNIKSYTPSVDLNLNIIRSTRPYVDIDHQNGHTSPSFKFINSKDQIYPYDIEINNKSSGDNRITRNTIDITNRSGKMEDLQYIARAQFRVPDFPVENCFYSTKMEQVNPSDGHIPNLNKSCEKKKIPIVIFVEGGFPAGQHDSLSQGVVHMEIVSPEQGHLSILGTEDSTTPYNLGAREFTYLSGDETHSNFFPRGVDLSILSKPSSASEFKRYSNIYVEPKKLYALRFYGQVTKKNSTGWRLKRITLYFPKYRNFVAFDQQCAEFDKQNGKCLKVRYNKKDFTNQSFFTNWKPNEKIQIVSLGCKASGSILSVSNCPSNSVCSTPSLSKEANNLCSISEKNMFTKNCPDNFGISGDANSLSNKKTALQICEADKDSEIDFNNPVVVSEKDITLKASFVHSINNCNDPKLSEELLHNSDLSKYKKIKTWTKKENLEPNIIKSTSNPEELIKTAEFSCPEIKLAKKVYDSTLLQETDVNIRDQFTSSLFNGEHNLINVGCNWEEKLKSDAIKLGMNENAFFKGKKQDSKIYFLPYPTNSLCFTQISKKDFFSDTATNQGIFTASEMPEDCNDTDVKCDLDFKGYIKKEDGDFEINKQIANDLGLKVAKSFFSDVAISRSEECNISNIPCFNQDIQFDGEKFNVQSSISVPLFLSLGEKSVLVTHRESDYWEGKHIKAINQ